MRIIQGKYRGFRFPAYHGDNTRPTTDMVKEALFNSLASIVDFEGLKVLDIFAGTGNIGLEFLSRGAAGLSSIDFNRGNIDYMRNIKKQLGVEDWTIINKDAMKFAVENTEPAGLVFADPPYGYTAVHEFVNCLLETSWFNSGNSVFVLEHQDNLVFNDKNVILNRQYGNTAFTCFKSNPLIA